MSDFKFACPSCSQRIAATDEYAGHQISCPVCHATITVPAAPGSAPAPSSIATPLAPGAPPPPAPPAKGRLSVSALSSPEHAAPPPASISSVGAAAFQAHLAKKEKKSYTGLISGIAAVLILGVAGFFGRSWLVTKYKDVSGETAREAATNIPPPPPPPPELTVDEIWQKVAEVYKGFPSLSATGKFTSVLDYSKVNASRKDPITSSGDLTLKMTKPANFRIDLGLAVGGTNVVTSGWSGASGSFVQFNNQRAARPTPEMVMDSFGEGLGVGAGDVVRLFVDDAHGTLPTEATDWARTTDEALNGAPCYVLTGTVKYQNVRVWVTRNTFLVAQTQVLLDGESSALSMDDAKIKSELMAMTGAKQITTAQINAVKTIAKLKGTVTDSYLNIQTNATISLAELEPDKPTVPVAAAPPPAETLPGGPGLGGSGPNGVPGRMRRGGGRGG